jgi:hypothetical protein
MRKRFVKKLTELFNDNHYILTKDKKDYKAFMPYHRLHFEIPNMSRVQIIERVNYNLNWEIVTRIDNLIDNRSYTKELDIEISLKQLFELSIKEEL